MTNKFENMEAPVPAAEVENTPDQVREAAPSKMKEFWALAALKLGLIKDEVLSNVKAAKKTVAEHPIESVGGATFGVGAAMGVASYLEGPQAPVEKVEVVSEAEQQLKDKADLAKKLFEDMKERGAVRKDADVSK